MSYNLRSGGKTSRRRLQHVESSLDEIRSTPAGSRSTTKRNAKILDDGEDIDFPVDPLQAYSREHPYSPPQQSWSSESSGDLSREVQVRSATWGGWINDLLGDIFTLLGKLTGLYWLNKKLLPFLFVLVLFTVAYFSKEYVHVLLKTPTRLLSYNSSNPLHVEFNEARIAALIDQRIAVATESLLKERSDQLINLMDDVFVTTETQEKAEAFVKEQVHKIVESSAEVKSRLSSFSNVVTGLEEENRRLIERIDKIQNDSSLLPASSSTKIELVKNELENQVKMSTQELEDLRSLVKGQAEVVEGIYKNYQESQDAVKRMEERLQHLLLERLPSPSPTPQQPILPRIDYMFAPLGAKIVYTDRNFVWFFRYFESFDETFTSETYVDSEKYPFWCRFLRFLGMNFPSAYPEKAIEASVDVGECFAFNGKQGKLTAKLWERVVPEAVTIEHISRTVSPFIESAPRKFRVVGLRISAGDQHITGIPLGTFEYDVNQEAIQTFEIHPSLPTTSRAIDAVTFEFLSNHGNSAYTCVYRVRLHGRRPDGARPAAE